MYRHMLQIIAVLEQQLLTPTLQRFPSTGNTVGDLAFAQDTKALYVWDGSEWNRVYNDSDETLTWTTEPPVNVSLVPSGPDQTVTIAATDSRGISCLL